MAPLFETVSQFQADAIDPVVFVQKGGTGSLRPVENNNSDVALHNLSGGV